MLPNPNSNQIDWSRDHNPPYHKGFGLSQSTNLTEIVWYPCNFAELDKKGFVTVSYSTPASITGRDTVRS